MISPREVDPAVLEWEEYCLHEMSATRSDMSRTIVVEATEECVAEDCYKVYAVKTRTFHYNVVGDGTVGTCGEVRQQGTSQRVCLALACRSHGSGEAVQ